MVDLDNGIPSNAFSLDQDSFDASPHLTMQFDPDISYLREVQTTMILVKLEAGLVVVQGLVLTFALESDMANLSSILLRSRKTLDVRPKSIIDHLESFGIYQVQFGIFKFQRWYHVLGIIGFELDTLLFGFVQLLEKAVMKPSTSIQCFS